MPGPPRSFSPLESRVQERAFSRVAVPLFAALAAAVLLSVPWDADPAWWDASRHAMDGAFYLDMIADLGFLDPVGYASEYYARYPAIAPVMYPPFFALCEAILYAPLGVHPWVARLTVALFLFAGGLGLLRLGDRLLGAPTGLFAGLLYLSFPLVQQWSREIMLEPAAAAMVIWSLVWLERFLASDRTRDLALCLGFAVLAPYTKQNTVFLFPTLLLAVVFAGEARRALDRRVIAGVAASALAGLPLAFVTFRWGGLNLSQVAGSADLAPIEGLQQLGFYLTDLPRAIGWPALGLAAIGAALLLALWRQGSAREQRLPLALLGAWLALCYLQMTLTAIKEPRFAFFWTPAFALAAAAGASGLAARLPRPAWSAALAALLMLALFGGHLARAPMAWSEGLAEVARWIDDHFEGSAVLTSVDREGALVLRIRELDHERRLRVYRSAKLFESMMVRKNWGEGARVESASEIREAIARYGIRHIVAEHGIRKPTEVETLLRETLAGDEFEVAAVFPVRYPNREVELVVYRFRGEIRDPGERPAQFLPIVGMELPGGGAPR